MNEHFSSHLEQVIQNYEKKFLKSNMSVKRSKDIIEIRGIMKDELESKGVSGCIISLKDYLKKIQTGQWIFKTGRSRLRDDLNSVLFYYENPISQSLLQYISVINYQLETTTSKVKKLENQNTSNDSIEQVKVEISELMKEIQQLKEENNHLRQRNHELSQKVIENKRHSQYLTPPSSPQKAQGDDASYSPKSVNS